MKLIVMNLTNKKIVFEGTEREIAWKYNLNFNQVKWLKTMNQTFQSDLLIVSQKQYKKVTNDPQSIHSQLYGSY